MAQGFKIHAKSPGRYNEHLPMDFHGPSGSGKHFYSKYARGGAGMWYTIAQTPVDSAETSPNAIDWSLLQKDGATPNVGEGGGWNPVEITGMDSAWSGVGEDEKTYYGVSRKDTDLVDCYWDEYETSSGSGVYGGTLHVLLVHSHNGGTSGARYINFRMTPSTDASTPDAWACTHANFTGGADNYEAGGLVVAHPDYIDASTGASEDPTTANFYPMSANYTKLFVENATDQNRRIWAIFYDADTDFWYANCSASADKHTGTWHDSWIAADAEDTSTIGTFVKLAFIPTLAGFTAGSGGEDMPSETNLKMVNVIENSVAKTHCYYTYKTGGNTHIYKAVKTPADAPSAATTHQFGTGASIWQETDGNVTNHFDVKAYNPDDVGLGKVVIVNKTSNNNIRLLLHKNTTGTTWDEVVQLLDAGSGAYAWPNVGIDSDNHKFYITYQEGYTSDTDDNCQNIKMMITDTDFNVTTAPHIILDAENTKVMRALSTFPNNPIEVNTAGGMMVMGAGVGPQQDGGAIGYSTTSIVNWDNSNPAADPFTSVYLSVDDWWVISTGDAVDPVETDITNITLTAPTGGEIFSVDDTITITWETS